MTELTYKGEELNRDWYEVISYEDRILFCGFEKLLFKFGLDSVHNPFGFPVGESMFWYSYSRHLENPLRNRLMEYGLTYTSEQLSRGVVEVFVKTKKGFTKKRTEIKIGRLLSQVIPKLPDKVKENIVNNIMDCFSTFEGVYYCQDDNIEDIVTMSLSPSRHLVSTPMHKNIYNSCMRYGIGDMGTQNYHPYKAYNSGDFEIHYILDKNGKLAARTLAYKKTKTHSAIYGCSTSAIYELEKNLKENGYSPVDEDGVAWEGAELLYIEDYVYLEDEEEWVDCVLAPYLDFFDGNGYCYDGHIYLHSERPEGKTAVRIDMFNGNGVDIQ